MPSLYPLGCITPSALHNLAGALNRLQGWHMRMQGKPEDTPCLRLLQAHSGDIITAIVTFADQTWTLIYKDGDWIYSGDNALC